MKKRNLKSLDLRKKTISTLQAAKIDGGSVFTTSVYHTPVFTITFGETDDCADDDPNN